MKEKARHYFYLIKIIRISPQLWETMMNFHGAICTSFFTLSYWNFSHMQFALSLQESVFLLIFQYLQEHEVLTTASVNRCKCTGAARYEFWLLCGPSPGCNPASDTQQALRPWAAYLNSLNFGFPFAKWRISVVHISWRIKKIGRLTNKQKCLCLERWQSEKWGQNILPNHI